MDKEVRAWDTYLELEATVKNMLTSLKAVSELQNPAIRTRHWKQLMVATKVGAAWRGYCILAGVGWAWASVVGRRVLETDGKTMVHFAGLACSCVTEHIYKFSLKVNMSGSPLPQKSEIFINKVHL